MVRVPLVGEGDMVATLKTFSGTHKGEFMGFPPTGRRVAYDVFDLLRVREDKIVEHWLVIWWSNACAKVV